MYSHTRQVTQYHPATFCIEAEIDPTQDPIQCAKALQELVIKVLYKDDAKQREHLINSLVYPEGKTPKELNNEDSPISKEEENDLPF